MNRFELVLFWFHQFWNREPGFQFQSEPKVLVSPKIGRNRLKQAGEPATIVDFGTVEEPEPELELFGSKPGMNRFELVLFWFHQFWNREPGFQFQSEPKVLVSPKIGRNRLKQAGEPATIVDFGTVEEPEPELELFGSKP
ncbi:hypothetical protein JCGZ_18721 [Jatropha curcas]|uniref:Uncharacterized protein n=1 Tax=Jatropha curcas TaxID=180498 RepID=A0A067K0Q4_JATCU|nr:hypothetical protein JCGZ_18721 [Jatropha curcas]